MPNETTVELWTLYAIAVSITVLRTYARIVAVGFKNFHADDWLIWFAILIYTAQCTLGYNIGIAAHGLANNGMTDIERSALSKDDPEYTWRIAGSKIQVAGWTTAATLLWTLKLCMVYFYLRLTTSLGKYRTRIHIALGFIIGTFIIVILTIYLSCRPFNHYWQINPNPGNVCQASISKPIIWVSFVTNVGTDAYLIMIPIPMLWKSSLKLVKKIAATLVLSAGVLVIVCATLKSVYVIVDAVHGGESAASWGTRETFIAVITTNLPMIFPLLKTWFAPFLPSTIRSSSNHKAFQTPERGFVTIGGGGTSGASRPNARHVKTLITFDNESEEHICKGAEDVKMQEMQSRGSKNRSKSITVKKQVTVTTEDRPAGSSQRSSGSFERV